MRKTKNNGENLYIAFRIVITIMYYVTVAACYILAATFAMFMLFYGLVSWWLLIACGATIILNLLIEALIMITGE